MLARSFAKRMFSALAGRGMPGGRSTTSLKQNRVAEKVDVLGKDNRAKREAREMANYHRAHAALNSGGPIPIEKPPTYGPRDWRFIGKGMAILFTAAGLVYLTFSPDDVSEDLQRIGSSSQARDAMSYVLTNPQAGFPGGRTNSNFAAAQYTTSAAPAAPTIAPAAPRAAAAAASVPNNPFAKLHAIEDAPPQQQFFTNAGGVYPNAAAAGPSRKARAAATAAAAASAAAGEPVAAGAVSTTGSEVA